jgi:hypothetical protein
MKNNRKIGIIIIVAILLLSFKNAPKRKGSLIIDPLQGNNIYALPGGYIYGSDPARPIYTFAGGELLTLISDTGMGEYQIEYIAPGGNKVTGYINVFDTEIK